MQTSTKLLTVLSADGGYSADVKATGPLAYWILGESSGTTAADSSGNGYNAPDAVGVTWGQEGIGDGNTCPLFDGTNDYIDTYSTDLRDAVNVSLLTIQAWCKVFNAGVWTNGATGMISVFGVNDINNYAWLSKSSNNNQLLSRYVAGGTAKSNYISSFSSTDWFHYLMRVDKANDKFEVFLDGVQQGATITGLGVWAGNIVENYTNIGALTEVPTSPWHGYLAHPAIWDKWLPDDDIAIVSTRPGT